MCYNAGIPLYYRSKITVQWSSRKSWQRIWRTYLAVSFFHYIDQCFILKRFILFPDVMLCHDLLTCEFLTCECAYLWLSLEIITSNWSNARVIRIFIATLTSLTRALFLVQWQTCRYDAWRISSAMWWPLASI